jgi:hypothetical protein
VLSGSGNLTAGGLHANDEQFELLRFPRAHRSTRVQADAHMTRWKRFYDRGLPLADAIRTDAWTAWEAQWAERETLQARARELDRELAIADATIGAPARGDGSAAVEQSTIRSGMERWYTDSEREVVGHPPVAPRALLRRPIGRLWAFTVSDDRAFAHGVHPRWVAERSGLKVGPPPRRLWRLAARPPSCLSRLRPPAVRAD